MGDLTPMTFFKVSPEVLVSCHGKGGLSPFDIPFDILRDAF
jgi:hypothetical protein